MSTLAKIPAGIHGITMERNSLVISDNATDEALHELGQRLATMDGALAWWLGDYGLALQKRKGEHYIKGQSVVLGISEPYWRRCVSVCRFYEPCIRVHTLSFTHHLTAMETARAIPEVAQPETKATALLSHAQAEGMSVSELRKHGRITLASPAKYQAEPETNPLADLDRADRWAIQHRDMVVQAEQAEFLCIRIAALIEFVDRVRDIAKQQRAA